MKQESIAIYMYGSGEENINLKYKKIINKENIQSQVSETIPSLTISPISKDSPSIYETEDFSDILSSYIESENIKDKHKWEREINEALAYNNMRKYTNDDKFCYFKQNEIINWGTNKLDTKHTYQIKKVISSNKNSCTYLVKDVYGNNVILKQFPKEYDFEYDVLKYIKSKYKCLKSFPCVKNIYKSDKFLYVIYDLFVDKNYITLKTVLEKSLTNSDKKQIKTILTNLVNLLVDIDVLHRMSLDDILLNDKNSYINLTDKEISIVNFNELNCVMIDKIDKNDRSKKDYKKVYKMWLDENIFNKLN
jgi:hypothetical protein